MLQIERLGAIAENRNLVFDRLQIEPLVLAPPKAKCEMCVIVPVRDEAQNLEATLAALAHQVDLSGCAMERSRYEIIILANNCSDQSAAIARQFSQANPTLALHVAEITLPPSEAHVGRARQILMDEAYRRLTSLGHKRGVIASTDGDTQVAPTWIAATMQEIAHGADAVGGRILTSAVERSALDPYARLCHLREVCYRYLVAELETYLDPNPSDPWPRHFQHFGASLAVTAQMYGLVGGLPAVRSSEDVAFYQALVRNDSRFRHSLKVRVWTSARQIGRANNGLANQLREWAVMGRSNSAFLVESPKAIAAKLHARRNLRVLWKIEGEQRNNAVIAHNFAQSRAFFPLTTCDEIAQTAEKLGVSDSWLAKELAKSSSFGMLIEQVEQYQQLKCAGLPQPSPLVEIESAIADLRIRLDTLRRKQNSLHRRHLLYI